MTRFINSVLITVVGFFLFLGVFWFFAGGSSAVAERPMSRVDSVTTHWGRSDETGTDLVVDIRLRNPGLSAGKVTSISYEIVVDGAVVDQGTTKSSVALHPQAKATVHVTGHVGPGFAATWWDSYGPQGEASELAVQGSIEVRLPDGDHSIPFRSTSRSQGTLASDLAEAAHNCDEAGATLCVTSAQAEWDGTRLAVTLQVVNQGETSVTLQEGTARLAMGGAAVATGQLGDFTTLGPGETMDLAFRLAPDAAALDSWWAGHVGRCEVSPAALEVDVTADGSGVAWRFAPTRFASTLVCGGGA